MPDRVFVDTSLVLALINERDQYYEQAEHLSHQFETSFLLTTDAVLLEIGNALAKDFRAEAIAIIKVLRSAQRVESQDNTLLRRVIILFVLTRLLDACPFLN